MSTPSRPSSRLRREQLGHRSQAAALLALLALCSSQLPGQQRRIDTRQFVDAIDVQIVNLDVYVTDRKGRPITGLDVDDFEVLEDGREVEITNFLAIEGLPSGEMRSRDGAPLEPLLLVFYLDNLLISPSARSRVLTDIDSFLQRDFPSETRFMLVTHDDYLDVPVAHTTDPEALRRGLTGLEGEASGVDIEIDRTRALSSIEQIYDACNAGNERAAGSLRGAAGGVCSPCADVWQEMVEDARQYAVTAERRLAKATTALARFIAALGGLPGRKAMIYLSGGLEQRPGYDLFLTLGDYCPDREREINTFHFEYNETTRLNQLAAHANANRVTFYPLDTGGARPSRGTRVDEARISNLQGSLFIFAKETGGEAIFNANRPLSELEQLTVDLTNYYSIAYRPLDRSAADAHLVDVRLRKGKHQVRYRRTLRDKSEEEKLAERLMATLLLGAEDNPLGIAVGFEDQHPLSDELVRLPVRIEVPAPTLLRLDDGSSTLGRLRVFMTARDERNRGTTVGEKKIELTRHDFVAGADEQALSYVVNVDLAPGRYRVAIGVRDETAKSASYLRREVEVEEPSALLEAAVDGR